MTRETTLTHDERRGTVVLQLAMGSYRQGLLTGLANYGSTVTFVVGDEHFGRGVVTDVRSGLVRRSGPNRFFLRRKLGYQRTTLRIAVHARVLVVELNPRIVSSWLAIFLRKLLGLATVGWGHADSRQGSRSPTTALRRVMQALCDGHIAYTRTEATRLSGAFPSTPIVAATNALYSEAQIRPVQPLGKGILVIGRLVPEKAPSFAVEVFHSIRDRVPAGCVLHIVGDGGEREYLARTVEKHGLGEAVKLYGAVSDYARLREIFEQCAVVLVTGYAGLNVIQALGFGVPVVYPRTRMNAPEVEALHAQNSLLYRENDTKDCGEAVLAVLTGAVRLADSVAISREIAATYSVESMVEPFRWLDGGA